MPTIETVSIDDVYPLTDEYGNSLATRDYSTKENKAYVKELARSMAAKGVPDEMVTLVRDGGIYRVKAGNSRIMAMRELGTRKFDAVVEDESTLQDTIATVIRTNTKKKYEAVEESRFIQQLALFADDEYVAEAAGIEVEQVSKVRRAMGAVKDAAEDMSLLRLIAIADYADDPDAVERLTNCSEKEFPAIERGLAAARDARDALEAMEAALAERCIEVVRNSPDGYRFVCSVKSPDDVMGLSEDLGTCVAENIYGRTYYIYSATEEPVDPEVEAAKAEKARRDDLVGAADDARTEWFLEHLEEPMPALVELGGNMAGSDHRVKGFIEHHGLELPETVMDRIYAYVMKRLVRFNDTEYWAEAFIALGDALAAHGYDASGEEEIAGIAKSILEGGE